MKILVKLVFWQLKKIQIFTNLNLKYKYYNYNNIFVANKQPTITVGVILKIEKAQVINLKYLGFFGKN